MELKHYRLTFANNKEFMVESPSETEEFLQTLERSFFKSNEYISLKLKEGEPLNLRKNQLFSVQRVENSLVGGTTRIWKIL